MDQLPGLAPLGSGLFLPSHGSGYVTASPVSTIVQRHSLPQDRRSHDAGASWKWFSRALGLFTGSALAMSGGPARRPQNYRREVMLSSLCATKFIEDTRKSVFGPECGDQLKMIVKCVHDCGLFGDTTAGVEAFIPRFHLARPKGEYHVGMELDITVIRPRLLDEQKDEVMATDEALQPLSSLRNGVIVEGKVVNVDNSVVLLNIGFAKMARCWFWHLHRGKPASHFQKGDVVTDLRVIHVFKTRVQVTPAEQQLRPLRSMKVGECLEGHVTRTSTKHQAVFFDVFGTDNVAAFASSGQLCKGVRSYDFGEKRYLEVVKVVRDRVYVKDLGSELPRA